MRTEKRRWKPRKSIGVYLRLSAAVVLSSLAVQAQSQHVSWSTGVQPSPAAPGGKALLRITAKVDPGWHIYSGSSPAGIPASFKIAPNTAIEKVRTFQASPKKAYDPNFGSETETYEGEAAFILELQLKKDASAGEAQYPLDIKYETCNASECDPSHWTGTFALAISPSAAAAAPAIPAGFSEVKPRAGSPADAASAEGWPAFLALAFGFGLASIFTPCVFPMIPITMSYFVNKPGSLKQAVTFCLGIIVLFSGIGLAVTAALGPVGVVALGQSPWVNGFIAVLFVVFGLSLLGAFEITIPSGLLTKLNQS
jgi:thiol:disulfide interchange protein